MRNTEYFTVEKQKMSFQYGGQQEEGRTAHAHSLGHQKLGTNTWTVIRTLFSRVGRVGCGDPS